MIERMKLKYKAADYETTLGLATALLELEPENGKALYYKAVSLMKTESYEESYQAFDALLQVDPENTTALKSKANISLKNKNYDAAVQDYSKLIAVDADHKYFYNRALSYMRLERWSEALGDLSKVISEKPDHAEAFYNRSNVHLQLKDNDKACADMRQAGKLGYDDAINYILGICG